MTAPRPKIEIRRRVKIAGVVTDARTGLPLAGAAIAVTDAPAPFKAKQAALDALPARFQPRDRPDRATSRSDGAFYFLDLPAGDYRLEVRPPAPAGRYGVVAGKAAKVAADGAARVDLALTPTVIAGRVEHKTTHEPIGGAWVSVRGDTRRVTTRADDDRKGGYELTHVLGGNAGADPPVKVTLQARAEGFKDATVTVTVVVGTTTTATPLALEPA